MHGRAPLSDRYPELPLAGFGFLVHFAWEMLQVPWFTGMVEASHGAVVWLCTKATGGDVFILLVAFWLGSSVVGRRGWLAHGSRAAATVVVVTGLAITVGFEYLAIGVLGRWSYDDAMPVLPVVGTGLLPLLQWLLLPPLILWLSRRHVLGQMALGRSD